MSDIEPMDDKQIKKEKRRRYYALSKEHNNEYSRRYYKENPDKFKKYIEERKSRYHLCDCGAMVRYLKLHKKSKLHHKRMKMLINDKLQINENPTSRLRGDKFDIHILESLLDVEDDNIYKSLETDEERKDYLEELLKLID